MIAENTLIALALIILLANTTEAISGFGSTIISVTLGSNFIPINELIPVLVPLNVLLSFYIVSRYHDLIEPTFLLKKILPFMGIGLVIGLLIFNVLQGNTLKKIYGVLVFILSVRELLKIRQQSEITIIKKLSATESTIWLLASGIIHGIYASGGPLLVYAMSSFSFTKAAFRSNLSVIWLILNSVLSVTYAQTGKINSETLKLSLMLLPVLPLGIFIGEILHHRINEKVFRTFIFSLLLLAGITLALKN
jgi:uncharacterized membrane protein YfcA